MENHIPADDDRRDVDDEYLLDDNYALPAQELLRDPAQSADRDPEEDHKHRSLQIEVDP